MSTDAGHERVYRDLVAGLVDARDDPVTARFDDELAAAVARGDMTADAAHRLRFWQRASVRALADHTMTVLPAALGALAASRDDVRAYAREMVTTIAPAAQPVARTVDIRDTPDPASSAAHRSPSSLEGSPPPRLMVADLVLTPSTARTEH